MPGLVPGIRRGTVLEGMPGSSPGTDMTCCGDQPRGTTPGYDMLWDRRNGAGFRGRRRTTLPCLTPAVRHSQGVSHMRRRTLLGALPAAIALARPAIGQGTAARTLRFVPQANLTSPDPIWTTANVTRNHAYMVWDTLYGLDAALQPQPQMCAGHEVSDDHL